MAQPTTVWLRRGPQLNGSDLKLFQCMRALFARSRNSLGSREMMKKLREEGYQMDRYRVRQLIKPLGLVVTQRVAYKVYDKMQAQRCGSRQPRKLCPVLFDQNKFLWSTRPIDPMTLREPVLWFFRYLCWDPPTFKFLHPQSFCYI